MLAAAVVPLLSFVASPPRSRASPLVPGALPPSLARRSGRVACWTGETSATLEMPDIPIATLYREYADLSRMTEWSPLLESVTVDPDSPNYSLWVMRVPGALTALASYLGYEPTVTWEADLTAPGPPTMRWTSSVRAGVHNAGARPRCARIVGVPEPHRPQPAPRSRALPPRSIPAPVGGVRCGGVAGLATSRSAAAIVTSAHAAAGRASATPPPSRLHSERL